MNCMMQRASGVLMHISSLPGETGIGTFGKSAYEFVDYLKESGQTYWQILPLCPTSFGDSPYQSFSTFAGNPYFIDLQTVAQEGYLEENDYESVNWGDDPCTVDYALLYVRRHELFEKIQANFEKKPPADYAPFCRENAAWLDDYALFMAIKDAHGGRAFDQWEEDIRCRKKDALAAWSAKCARRVEYYKILQYLFFRQWFALKDYANQNGIKIIGDLPIYVSADSADVWAEPRLFDMDADLRPVEVAGCPPDSFSDDGQFWGNPVYNWKYHKKTKYKWWIERLVACLKIYDVVRIDHFRGFDSYYCIPYGAKTARKGQWRKGPGMQLWGAVKKALGDPAIIAEDLGFMTDSVRALLRDSGFPGMKILQFAFAPSGKSGDLPHRFPNHCVAYTGTHDNDTILGWLDATSAGTREYAMQYLCAQKEEDIPQRMMIALLSSVANTAILTMQDLLGLGAQARMNIPSTVGGNWQWRAKAGQIDQASAEFLKHYTKVYGRANQENLSVYEQKEKNTIDE